MTRRALASGALLVAAGLLSLAAVAAALVSQHVFDMQPCPWCVLQRAIFVGIAIVGFAGAAWRSLGARLVAAATVLLLAVSGIASALWQHFQAAASQSCNLTFADKIVSDTLHLDRLLPDVFSARASCADAAINLLGVPYDFWALGTFIVVALLAVVALRAGPTARRSTSRLAPD